MKQIGVTGRLVNNSQVVYHNSTYYEIVGAPSCIEGMIHVLGVCCGLPVALWIPLIIVMFKDSHCTQKRFCNITFVLVLFSSTTHSS